MQAEAAQAEAGGAVPVAHPSGAMVTLDGSAMEVQL